MRPEPEVAGAAALAICESLLLCLSDRGILRESDVIDILEDAAAAHRHGGGDKTEEALHAAVAKLIRDIIAGGNSVRHR